MLKKGGVHESDIDDLEQQVWIVALEAPGQTLKKTLRPTPVRVTSARSQAVRPPGTSAADQGVDSVLTAELESTLLDPGPGPFSEYECKERRDRAGAILAAARSSLPTRIIGCSSCVASMDTKRAKLRPRSLVSEECAKKRLQRAVQAIKALPLRREDL